ncbi:MAG: aspartate-alanine antiporter [Planctomycetes bacterium]|nr:aspartate-alanine antiporter [Planctomycetota bacterium]
MQWIMHHIHWLLNASPELTLFLCLALGYRIGKINFGKFQLGGVAGSLLVAVIVSQFGVTADGGLKNVLFALFIYAVGYESGPQFFRSLNRQSIREILLAACLAITALATVLVLAKLFHLDKGMAAGIAAGGLTQSAIIGTAGDAITRLGLAADQVTAMQQNVAIGYAVTYVFGSFGAIIVCVNILPWFMKRTIRDDAMNAEASLAAGLDVLQPGEELAVRKIVGRIFRLNQGIDTTVGKIESVAADSEYPVTVEQVKRGTALLAPTSNLTLTGGDYLLLVGSGEAVHQAAGGVAEEVYNIDGMELKLKRHEVVVTSNEIHGQPLSTVRNFTHDQSSHGIYLLDLVREGTAVAITPDTTIQRGDILTLYGSDRDVVRAASGIGTVITRGDKTDFVYMGIGLVVGLLIGLITVRIAGLPLTLGSGGGALLSGLLFGWMRTRKPTIGYMPSGAIQILKDLGLAGFVVVVGLQSGLQAVETVKQRGLTIFFVGVLVTLIPLILTMIIGRYLIGYKNVAVFAGALSGSRSANPAFGEILNKAGNAVPTVPFAITYAIANVLLTLLGPLVVSLA